MTAPPVSVVPEEVYLCVLCHYFVHPPPGSQGTGEQFVLSVASKKLALFLLKEIKAPGSARYTPLQPLCAKLVNSLGELGAELVRQLEIILQGLQSPDDVSKIFDALGSLLTQGRAITVAGSGRGIDPLSPMGLFLRKVRASFSLLAFEGVAQLAAQLRLALQEAAAAAQAAAQGTGSEAADSGDGSAAASSSTSSVPPLRDPAALEAYLDAQLREVERKGSIALTPELDVLLSELQAGSVGATGGPLGGFITAAAGPGGSSNSGAGSWLLPKALLVRLHCALAAKDFSGALAALHRYFDHVQARGPQGPIPLSEQPSAQVARARTTSSLLSLSALHTRFGHTEEALSSLSEALRAAQQHNDQWCLLHALAGLCAVLAAAAPGAPGLPPDELSAVKHGSQHVQLLRLLRRCLERGQELYCPHITAYAKLSLAQFALQHTVEPTDNDISPVHLTSMGLDASAVGSLFLNGGAAGSKGEAGSGKLGSADGAASAASSMGSVVNVPAPLQVQRMARDIGLLHHLAALEAAAPAAIGAPRPTAQSQGGATSAPPRGPLGADLFSGPHVFVHPSTRPTSAAAAASTQQAEGAGHLLHAAAWRVFGNSTLSVLHTLAYLCCYGTAGRSEDTAVALSQVVSMLRDTQGLAAGWFGLRVAMRALGLHTQPHMASDAAAEVQPAHALPPGPLAAIAAELLHDEAVAHGDMRAADAAASGLLGLAHPSRCLDMGTRMEAHARAVMSQLARGATDEAYTMAGDLFKSCARAGMQVEAVQALLTLAHTQLSAHNAAGALRYALSCALHAAAGHQDLVAAEACLLVGHTWLMLAPDQLREVLLLVQDALPLVMAHGSLALRARTQALLADALAAGPSVAVQELSERGPQLVAILEGSVCAYEKMESWKEAAHQAYLLAQVQHSLGHTEQRDAAAERWQVLTEMANTAGDMALRQHE